MIPVVCGFPWDGSGFAAGCSVLRMHKTEAEFGQLIRWASSGVSRLSPPALLWCLVLPRARQLPTFFTDLVRLGTKLYVCHKDGSI